MEWACWAHRRKRRRSLELLESITKEPLELDVFQTNRLTEDTSDGYRLIPNEGSRARSRQGGLHRNPLIHLPYVLCLLTLLFASVPSTTAASSCLRFADYDSINSLFTSGGPGTVIELCPSKTYRLSGPIIFTAADQEVTTFGRPTDDTRAILRVQGNGETAIQGDCRRCKGVKVRNLIIDGNRKKLGRSKPEEEAGGLVVLGGNEGQVIQDCIIRDPRGFTAIHIREGDKLECKGAKIVNNVIGPVGEEYDPKRDGEDPELSPLGRPLADGITLACRDSIVRDNVIIDNTAAGIVLYCSPGTLVENNSITAEKASAMAGILMVDATPFAADYTGVIVKANTIAAKGAGIRVGIGIGPTVWSDDTETILKGGTVQRNMLSGAHMGYGIAAAGLSGWTITGNVNQAAYEGKRSERCFSESVNPDPMPFLYTKATVTESKVQKGFVDAQFQYDPLDAKARKQANGKAKAAGGKKAKKLQANGAPAVPAGKGKEQKVLAGVQQPVKAAAGNTLSDDEDIEDDSKSTISSAGSDISAEPLEKFDTGSEMMDGILEHSRARLIEAIEALSGRVDGLFDAAASSNGGEGAKKAKQQPVGLPKKDKGDKGAMMGLQKRVEALEWDQGKLVEEATGLRTGMQKWNQDMSKVHAWEHELLLDIQSRLHHHFLTHPSDTIEISPGEHHDDHSGHEANQEKLKVPHEQAGKESKERGNLRQRSERARLLGMGDGDGGGAGSWSWFRWLGLAAVLGSILRIWSVWKRRQADGIRQGGHIRTRSESSHGGSPESVSTGVVGGPGTNVGPISRGGSGVSGSGNSGGGSGSGSGSGNHRDLVNSSSTGNSRGGTVSGGWGRWFYWKGNHRKEM